MNRQVVSAIALAVAALSAGQALAQDAAPKTREQVRAELAEAIRNGDMVADGETGRTFREMFPGQYPAANTVAKAPARVEVKAQVAPAQGKTRAEVKAELAEAIRNGDMVADGQTGATYRDLFPGRYPVEHADAQGKTRADVKAELAEAVRTGNIVAGDNGKTLRELNPGRYPAVSAN